MLTVCGWWLFSMKLLLHLQPRIMAIWLVLEIQLIFSLWYILSTRKSRKWSVGKKNNWCLLLCLLVSGQMVGWWIGMGSLVRADDGRAWEWVLMQGGVEMECGWFWAKKLSCQGSVQMNGMGVVWEGFTCWDCKHREMGGVYNEGLLWNRLKPF